MTSPAIMSAQHYEDDDATAAAGITITAHASANTKGSYTELIAATLRDSWGLMITPNVGSNGDFLIDIAIGAGGSEQIIVSNLLYSEDSTSYSPSPLFIPIRIPAGTRLSARCQASTGGFTVRLSVVLMAGGALAGSSLQRCTTYGAVTADSGGTSVDPGAVANTFGAYVELSSAITAPIRWLIVCLGNQANTARATSSFRVDIAIGAAAAEQVIVSRLQLIATVNHKLLPSFYCLPVDVPAGVRLAARAMSSITDATDRLIDVAVLGVD